MAVGVVWSPGVPTLIRSLAATERGRLTDQLSLDSLSFCQTNLQRQTIAG